MTGLPASIIAYLPYPDLIRRRHEHPGGARPAAPAAVAAPDTTAVEAD